MKVKKTARIMCANGNTFWATQKEFWRWVREGLVVVTGDYPLTGRFRGRREHLLVMIEHTILDKAAPVHLEEVMRAKRNRKRNLRGQRVLS